MEYYLLLPNDTEQDASNEANLLGDASFDIFWAGSGLRTLMRLVEQDPDMLPHCSIICENGKRLTITEFLDTINKLKVRMR